MELQRSDDIEVRASVLSAEEADRYFATGLTRNHIQPIWLRIDNGRADELVINPLAIDRDYFSSSEAAWRSRGLWERNSAAKIDYFLDQQIPLVIPPQSSVSGFVYTNLDPAAKSFTVQLLADRYSIDFDFVMLVPGFEADFMRFDERDRAAVENLPDLDTGELREYLEALPCCTLGGDRTTPGDPLNLVIIGQGDHVISSLVRRGWDLTEILTTRTAWKTIRSSLFATRYRTSPISPLYLFDRPQDLALQKIRQHVDERNHLRLWRAPVNHDGRPVWLGQISRDIGIKFSSMTFVTHRIDPYVDEARTYMILDLVDSQSVWKWGYVGGVGEVTRSDPRYNYTKDPYYTDGFRLVLVLGDEPLNYDQLESLDWEEPPPVENLLEE